MALAVRGLPGIFPVVQGIPPTIPGRAASTPLVLLMKAIVETLKP